MSRDMLSQDEIDALLRANNLVEDEEEAVSAVAQDVADFLDIREEYYATRRLDPKLAKFYHGWMNRLNDLRRFCNV